MVHLSKESVAPHCAQFVQSITGHFSGPLGDQTTVNCSLENNQFVLCEGSHERAVPLKVRL